jgi:hypothetical protein
MKARLSAFVAVTGLAIAAVMFLAATPNYSKSDQEKIKRGLEIAPVTLNLANKDKDMVGMGSYLVNASANCANCHSCPTYAPRMKGSKGSQLNGANYLAGGVPMAELGYNNVVSVNLTPDSKGLPAGLTLQQFKVSLTQMGHTTPEPSNPESTVPMPRQIYANFTNSDVAAIYEYLKAVPPAQPGSCKAPGEIQKMK